MADETIDLGQNINFEVHVHPMVIIQILDFYQRKYGAQRNNDDEPVYIAGALLGTLYPNKVHITNCYATHTEPDPDYGYQLDLTDSRDVYHYHLLANPNEVLIGGFVTTSDMSLDFGVAYLSTEFSKKDNGFNATSVLGQPIILKIDPTMKQHSIDMRAYKLNQSLKHYAAVASFNTLPIKISFADETYQQIYPFLASNLQQKDFRIINTTNSQQFVQEANKNIDKIIQYIENVINGNEEGNQEFGRKLLSLLNRMDLIKSNTQIEENQIIQQIGQLILEEEIVNEKLQQV